MTGKSMVWREVRGVVVVVHGAQAPMDGEWEAFVDVVRERLAQDPTAFLVVTSGGAPNARQRRSLTEALAGRAVPVAVVTDMALLRGIVTAFGWFNRGIRGFALRNGAGTQEALRYLRIEGFLAARILLETREMQREVAASA
jgi:hypothetical protein